MSGLVELKIDGVRYGGWQRARVSRSIERLSGSFDLEITERWPGQPTETPLRPGQRCRLELDGEPVISGWVDSVTSDYDASKHTLRVTGRDATGDLCDCSAIHRSGQWHNVKIDQLASDLLAPYKIAFFVENGVDTGALFTSFDIEEGETVFECLSRAARMRALLLTSTPYGDLVITRAGQKRLASGLLEGGNIQAARAEFQHQERFSEITVKGQSRLGGDGETEHAASSGTANDKNITRHRPLIVISDAQSNNAALSERAQWECNVRKGRALRGEITVQGWTDHDGALWTPNTVLPVTSPLLWLDAAELLIVGCVYTLDCGYGTQTEIELTRPDAFDLIAEKEKTSSTAPEKKDWRLL
jgi:prophage tail gpP-like protein